MSAQSATDGKPIFPGQLCLSRGRCVKGGIYGVAYERFVTLGPSTAY